MIWSGSSAPSDEKGIAFTVTIDPDLPPITFDEHQLLQALRNLLRNAIEAMEETAVLRQ
jgi:signal transduction histidine kinase